MKKSIGVVWNPFWSGFESVFICHDNTNAWTTFLKSIKQTEALNLFTDEILPSVADRKSLAVAERVGNHRQVYRDGRISHDVAIEKGNRYVTSAN